MEEDWANLTDPKEKKKIQNRVAQRVHRTKLKTRIRQLEEQLESITSATAQNDTSKSLSAYDDSTLSFAIPGVSPVMSTQPMLDRLGTGSFSDATLFGSHAPMSLLESDTAGEKSFIATPQAHNVAQLDLLSRNPVEAQSLDLEWLLASGSGTLETVPDHPQVHSSSAERGRRNPDHVQSMPNTSLPRHLAQPDHARVGGSSGQSAQKMTTAPVVQNTGQETLPRQNVTKVERLTLLVEASRRLGFSNLDEALSVYYTSDLSKSAILSHEQSLNRARQLPNFLSTIREHSKQWRTWERANYVRETLRSAEEIYAEECKLARMTLREQGDIGLSQKGLRVEQMFQITRALQQEIPNTWALITSIILHAVIPGEPQRPQTILMVMMLLCYRSQDPVTTLGLCQEYLYQHNGTNDHEAGLLH